MTTHQKDLVIRVFQFGFATGARHRYECLLTFIRAYPELKEPAISACAAFERGCGWCQESTENLNGMSDAEFFEYVVRNGEKSNGQLVERV